MWKLHCHSSNFYSRIKKKNPGVRFQERSIPVKCNVELSELFFRVIVPDFSKIKFKLTISPTF